MLVEASPLMMQMLNDNFTIIFHWPSRLAEEKTSTIQYKIFIINDNILSSMILRHPNLCIIFTRMAQKIAHLILYLLPLLLWDLSQCWRRLEAEKDVSARGHGPVDLRQELVHAHVVRSDKSVSDGLELGRQRRWEYRKFFSSFVLISSIVCISIYLSSLSLLFLSLLSSFSNNMIASTYTCTSSSLLLKILFNTVKARFTKLFNFDVWLSVLYDDVQMDR